MDESCELVAADDVKDSPALRKPHALPVWGYEALLVLAAVIWGFGTVVVKDAVNVFPTMWLVGFRFLSAGILLSLVIAPRMVRSFDFGHLKAGAILGTFVALTYLFNTTGLAYTTGSNSSFLTATYCVMVPFLAWMLMRKRPNRFNMAAGVLCLAGIALVALPSAGGLHLGLGDGLTLISALFCGIHITLIAKFAPGRDMLVLTALQFLAAGVVALAVASFMQEPPSLSLLADPDMLGSLVYLVVCATCVTLALQNIGLAHVDPAPAALLLSTEAVFGVIFSIMFLGETLTPLMLAGFALIFIAVLVSEWLPLKQKRPETDL
ncbi:MAG: DMT family transporter [Eggerthellaceae bacterium]|nr:DMT family transporter [Eggerthellaceae bacterium]